MRGPGTLGVRRRHGRERAWSRGRPGGREAGRTRHFVSVGNVEPTYRGVWLRRYHRSSLRFFRDGWNVFDFTVIVLSLLPVGGQFATVSRLARLLRVTRLVSVSFELRLIVQTMLRSIPSMGHVSLLLGLLIYVYGIVGFYSFGATDPVHWGSLGVAMLSVFELLTLEGWVEMQRALLPAHPWAWLYFGSFVVVGVFSVINLFIAIVLNNLERVRAEERLSAAPTKSLQVAVTELKDQLARFEAALESDRGGAQKVPREGT